MRNALRSMHSIFLCVLAIWLLASCGNLPASSQTKPKTIDKITMNKKLENLKDLQWKNRIILVKQSDKEMLKVLRDEVEEIKDRDLIWFFVNEKNIETNYKGQLSENFIVYLDEKYFREFAADVLLIGKDGTVKSKDAKLDLKDYFEQIDAMPMRQREMMEKSQ